MSKIEFYFDFSSPYGYLASTQIDDLAAKYDRQVRWRPYLLGTAMKQTGHQPLSHVPMLKNYVSCDVPRFARLLEVPFTLPDPFPIATVSACRVYYWRYSQDQNQAKQLAKALYHAYFVEGRNISKVNVVEEVVANCGIDGEELAEAVRSQAVKDAFRAANDNALDKGVFGSPFIIVDGQPFWGADRLYQVETWLNTGGW